MIKFIIRKGLSSIPMLLLVSVIIFIGLEFMPGDPITYRFSPEALSNITAEELDELRDIYGLNDSVVIRYFRWFLAILQGDFGISISTSASIAGMLKSRLPATLELVGAALLISTVFGIIMGFISAVKKNTIIDYGSAVFGIMGVSIPAFFLGLAFIRIFGIELAWFPVTGRILYSLTDLTFWDRLRFLIMPSVALSFNLTGSLMRYTRGSMVNVLAMDYVKTARSKGLPMYKVYIKHAFRNALMPVVYLLCFRLPLLIGSSVIIENTFGWSGMGQMLLRGLMAKDYPVVMMVIMASAVLVLFASLLVDVFTALLDPRVRLD